MSPENSLTSKNVGITTGILMLLTFLIPFGVKPDGTPIWSWDLLNHFGEMPGELRALLLGGWIIGLLALVLGASLRGLPLAICYTALAVAAAVTLLSIMGKGMSEMANLRRGDGPANGGPMLVLMSIVTAAFLVVGGVRVRLGASVPTCVAQVAVSALLLILLAVYLCQAISQVVSPPLLADKAWWWYTIGGLVFKGLLILAGLFALIHGCSFKSPNSELTSAACTLTQITLLGMLAFVLILPMATMKVPAELVPHIVLTIANPVIIVVGMVVLFLEALTALISEVGALAVRSFAYPLGHSMGGVGRASVLPGPLPMPSIPPSPPVHPVVPPVSPTAPSPRKGPPPLPPAG